MVQIRNISRESLHVPLLGRVVEPDELVEIDDVLLAGHVWPPTTWRVETEPANTKGGRR
jgi:hypothetical protein